MFSNNPIEIQQIPPAENIQYVPIKRSYIPKSILELSIFFAILLLIIIVIQEGFIPGIKWLPKPYGYLIYGALLMLYLFQIFMIVLGYKQIGYAFREQDVAFKKGLLFRKWIHVPYNRIQHAEVNQSLLDRTFKIGSLKLFTAGDSSSDLKIPGLSMADAEKFKQFVLNQNKFNTISDEEA